MASQKARRKKWLYLCLFLIFLAVFLASTGYLISWLRFSRANLDAYRTLSAQVDALRPSAAAPSVGNPESCPDSREEPEILPEYAALAAENPDMAGWLSIDGTDIHYPVMYAPDRKDYYLSRDFSGNPSAWGAIYIQENCNPSAPSDNVILYGHNMKDGSMFAQLFRYTDEAFLQSHPYICFDTLFARHQYRIFAVFTTTATPETGFAYYDFVQAEEDADFTEFIRSCLSLSLWDTGITPAPGDKILCLSTCEYSKPNGRLVVAAVRVP